ncbi:bifunctional aminoglycoside phosphotransferase/ATP-binding protein [Roseomonas sp. KE0001]|uniref:bifunctional aminoglycoside phosphotransferase/ATP-binding protein n=1 Tax=Roseomonas sp. KE0001 TaxID=2479201 RepID=UPI0018E0378B|nr:bifunctional aminoglycoside phosphotransferase/ATP-binding protein [Roseomonas sp. KE0001]MBI0435373.1 hypothetical protein [Roseomonas sp. KE0001]
MSIPFPQREVVAQLCRLTGAAPLETHISAVFIGRDRVLKLKKAVSLGFLDFTLLAARERFCRRELELNAAAAPGLYRAVLPVVRRAGGLVLGGAPDEGEVVDWVVEMAPVPSGDFLDAVARRGGLDDALQDALGDAVAALHAALPPVAGWDSPGRMAAVLDGNVAAARAAGLPPERVAAWEAAARTELARRAPALAARAAAGAVRRCHGDLHLGNLLLWRGRPAAFDALEFDEVLATIDTGYDLAFLLMDLGFRLGAGAANRVLNRYVARRGDAGLVAGLPFWISMRAMIRAHVQAAAGGGRLGEGLGLLDLAQAALRPAPGGILAIGGLPGSGKSHLARRVAPDLGAMPGALMLRSDEIRKRRHGVAPEVRLPPGAYAPEVSAAVHDELFAAAETAARAGHAVIADAAFLDPALRAGIAAAAARAGVPFRGIWLEAPLPVLRARVAARRGDASDADLAVLERAARRDPGPLDWTRVAAGDGEVVLPPLF